jgi:hypothetical protein
LTKLFSRLSYLAVPAATFAVVLTVMRLYYATAEFSDALSSTNTGRDSPVRQVDGGATIPVERIVDNAISNGSSPIGAPPIVPPEVAPVTLSRPIHSQSPQFDNTFTTNNLLLDSLFESEPEDLAWAPPMEVMLTNLILSIVGDVQELKVVECRTTVCRAVVVHTSARQALDNATRNEEFVRESTLFTQSVRPIIVSSAGRLTRSRVERVPPSAENESWSSIFLVSGTARPTQIQRPSDGTNGVKSNSDN